MVWHMVRCKSGQERKMRNILRRNCLIEEAWYPASVVRPKAKRSNTRKHAKRRLVADIPGYILVRATRPLIVHDFADLAERMFLDFVRAADLSSYQVTEREIGMMRRTPQSIKAIAERQREAERAAREARRPIVGQHARICDDATIDSLRGRVMKCEGLRGEEAGFDTLMGIMWVPVEHCERILN